MPDGGMTDDAGGGGPDLPMLLPPDAGCGLRTCGTAGANCGPVGDGCGALLDCGSCANGEICGGGGPSVCGVPTNQSCAPKSCTDQGFDCGPAGDGCGNPLSCGSCGSGKACGIGGSPGVCAGVMCTATTCNALGFNCGFTSDGCSAVLDCSGGTNCPAGETCGGGGEANKCGKPATGTPCTTGLCLQQKVCSNPAVTTTLTGTVYAPTDKSKGYGDPDPIYGATVYVPNAAVQPFTAGVSCVQCGSELSGSPVVQTTTGVDGKFTLTNVPVGTNIPLVIQVGRWRRKITIPNVPECVTTPLTADQTRLPRKQSEGDIPLIAVVTGKADPLECILPKMGIDPSEFTSSTGTGRVRFYRSNGMKLNGTTIKDAATLFDDINELKKYDLVISDCEGGQIDKSDTQKNNVIDYTSAGGRLYATHYQYTWLYNIAPFSSTATWNVKQSNPSDLTALIDQTFAKGMAFAQWLMNVSASTTLGKIPVKQVRHDFDAVIPPSQRWIYADPADSANTPLHYTFNTPVGVAPTAQCGRVMYSDFHVHGEQGGFDKKTFPADCGGASPLSPQEKVLEFMLFDLTSCIAPDNNNCTAKTCAQLGYNCGEAGDGCGGKVTCGTCPDGQVCGGSGMANVCGGACTPRTCADQGLNCGPAGDGCGNSLDCGTCVAPATCGGGGVPGQCGTGGCTPTSCAAQNANCGLIGDGCGGSLDCGVCMSPETCGGAGVANQCGEMNNPPIL